MTSPTDAPTLSLREAGSLLGVSKDTVARMVARGDLQAVQLPGVRRTAVLRWSVEALIPQPAVAAS